MQPLPQHVHHVSQATLKVERPTQRARNVGHIPPRERNHAELRGVHAVCVGSVVRVAAQTERHALCGNVGESGVIPEGQECPATKTTRTRGSGELLQEGKLRSHEGFGHRNDSTVSQNHRGPRHVAPAEVCVATASGMPDVEKSALTFATVRVDRAQDLGSSDVSGTTAVELATAMCGGGRATPHTQGRGCGSGGSGSR